MSPRLPGPRVAASLVQHGLRARLGRPCSRTVGLWSLVVATICGLFAASAGSWVAWHTARPLPDRDETVALVDGVVPNFRIEEVWGGSALFLIFGQPLSWDMAESLLWEGNEYALAGSSATMFAVDPVASAEVAVAAEQGLRARGWELSGTYSREGWTCGGPLCDRTAVPIEWVVTARRGDTIATFQVDPPDLAGSQTTRVVARLDRATPSAVAPAAVVAGLVGAALGWLIFAWASRRTTPGNWTRWLANVLCGVTMLLWWFPVVLIGPWVLQEHLDRPHPRWAPPWEWLGQPLGLIFFFAGSASALLALGIAVLPRRAAARNAGMA